MNFTREEVVAEAQRRYQKGVCIDTLYNTHMDKHNELDRFTFILKRDGADEARLYAQRMIDIYRANCKSGRKKYGKNYPYRAQYVESIYSFRYLLKEMK